MGPGTRYYPQSLPNGNANKSGRIKPVPCVGKGALVTWSLMFDPRKPVLTREPANVSEKVSGEICTVRLSIPEGVFLVVLLSNMALTSSEPDTALFHTEDAKPRTARRNLFGPVDHQQLQQDFQQLLHTSVEEASRRWNFDFQQEQPMQGAIQWEELRCWEVPKFYRSCVVKGGRVGPRVELFGEERGPAGPASGGYLEMMARETYRGHKPEKRPPAPAELKQKQAAITDFFTVKKRRLLHPKASGHQ